MAVLPFLIGIQNQFASTRQMLQCFFQHLHYKGKTEPFFDLTTYDFSIIWIKDKRQIQFLATYLKLCHISYPFPIGGFAFIRTVPVQSYFTDKYQLLDKPLYYFVVHYHSTVFQYLCHPTITVMPFILVKNWPINFFFFVNFWPVKLFQRIVMSASCNTGDRQ